MKTLYLSVLTLIFSITVCAAQPLLRNFENLAPGSRVKYFHADTTGIYAGPAGESVTWNFNNLLIGKDTLVESVIFPSQTPQAADYPDANIVKTMNDGSILFLKQKPDTNYVLGVFNPGFGIKIKYINPYTMIKRPFKYLDSITDYHTRTYTLSGSTFRGGGTTVTKADAYGSLIVNGKVYNDALRIRYEQVTYDTSQGGDGTVIKVTAITNSWYDSLHASPLLTIDSLSVESAVFSEKVKNITVFLEEFNSSVAELKAPESNFKAFINADGLNISCNEVGIKNAQIQMLNAAGQDIINEKINIANGRSILSLEDKNLKPGIYFVKMNYLMNGQKFYENIRVLKL